MLITLGEFGLELPLSFSVVGANMQDAIWFTSGFVAVGCCGAAVHTIDRLDLDAYVLRR